MTKLLSTIAAAMVFASSALAEQVTDFMLDNGMQVVVIEDHRAPVVVHMVWYKAGAADEQPGQSGIAHFLEHLTFKQTENLSAGELSATVAANGGSDNAFTGHDYTAYFQRVAADRLELMMSMEADRMANLRLSEDDIVTERDVILEERNQRTDSNPGALFSEQRTAAQFMNHRYGIPIIGWRHEMETLSLEDAQSFYDTYYAPNNAVLVVAGDVLPDDVKALADTYYGVIPANLDIPERERAQEPPHRSERRLTYKDPRTTQPYVIRTYLAPERDSGDQKTAAALELLSAVLGGNAATSFLGERLQFDSEIATYTSAFYDGMSLDDTTFGLVIVPSEDVSLEDGEAALDDAIAAFMEQGVDAEQLGRIKSQIRAAEIYARDNVEGTANRYGAALTQGLTIQDVQDWPDILQSITAQDIMAAAEMIFDRSNAVTGWMQKPSLEDAQ